VIRISREAGIPAEVYHIKASGEKNWPKEDELLARIEAAQKKDSKSGPTCTPTPQPERDSTPVCPRGPKTAVIQRCSNDCAIRLCARKLRRKCESILMPGRTCISRLGRRRKFLLVGFKSEKLKPLTGKSLAEVAKMRGKDPIETIMDLISEDESRIGTVYFLMSEENVKKELAKALDFVRLRRSLAGAGGRFPEIESPSARLREFRARSRKYARDEKVITLPEAVRRLSALPATNLGLDHRGFHSRKECSPTWSSLIPRQLRTGRPSTNPISTRLG
jgi:N-acyl-D-amino-acid deacylase